VSSTFLGIPPPKDGAQMLGSPKWQRSAPKLEHSLRKKAVWSFLSGVGNANWRKSLTRSWRQRKHDKKRKQISLNTKAHLIRTWLASRVCFFNHMFILYGQEHFTHVPPQETPRNHRQHCHKC
jgi:hypothetical protein